MVEDYLARRAIDEPWEREASAKALRLIAGERRKAQALLDDTVAALALEPDIAKRQILGRTVQVLGAMIRELGNATKGLLIGLNGMRDLDEEDARLARIASEAETPPLIEGDAGSLSL